MKKLKEYNEDSSDLGCPDEKYGDENGLIYSCEKLGGKLASAESKAALLSLILALVSA